MLLIQRGKKILTKEAYSKAKLAVHCSITPGPVASLTIYLFKLVTPSHCARNTSVLETQGTIFLQGLATVEIPSSRFLGSS